MLKTADLAQKAVKVSYNRSPRRTYAVGTSNGGYQVRRAMEEAPNLFDGGVDWEGTYINPYGPNLLIDLPPAIRNFPDYASNYDPNSQAAQNILAAGYPPDIVVRNSSGTVTILCGSATIIRIGKSPRASGRSALIRRIRRTQPGLATTTTCRGSRSRRIRRRRGGRDDRKDQETPGDRGGDHGRPVADRAPGACLRDGGQRFAQGQQ